MAEEAVTTNAGTVDKQMVTASWAYSAFRIPSPGDEDIANAARAALAIQSGMSAADPMRAIAGQGQVSLVC